MLEKFFQLSAHDTTPQRELIAGLTTFVTMAYICAVNPAMLAEAGMDFGAVFVATCLVSAIGCFLMGGLANYPIAIAPGMGLNAFFAYGVVIGAGYDWRTALGAVFWAGLIFLLLSVSRARAFLVDLIPSSVKTGVIVGIGLFLALIGLRNAGLVVGDDATLVGLGDMRSPEVALSLIGFCLTAALVARGFKAAIIIVIGLISLIGVVFFGAPFHGVFGAPPSPAATFAQLDLLGALNICMAAIIIALVFIDVFDTSGTLIAIGRAANLADANDRLAKGREAMVADSAASVAGAVLGTSTATSYIESRAGVAAGGRTGLAAVVVGCLFMLTLFLAPLAQSIPSYATAPALIFVAILMVCHIAEHRDWEDVTETAPMVLTAIMMPFAFSIADGIAVGFISYALLKLFAGRRADLNPAVIALAALFVARFAFLDVI